MLGGERGPKGEGPSRLSPAPLLAVAGACGRRWSKLAAPGDDAAPAAGPPPAPLPAAAPPPRALPALDLSLSPARAGGGILRRRGPGARAGGRQVRFRLSSDPDEACTGPVPAAPGSPPVTAVLAPFPAEPGGAEALVKMGLGAPEGEPPPGGSLATPALHTSLALGEEVWAAAQAGFDAHRAAQELLASSFLARCSVEGKAAAAMNIPREQQLYQGLVSLQVPAEEVLSCALQEKLSLIRPQPEPRREPEREGPDLRMFFEPRALVAETPCLGVAGLPPLRLQPHTRPPAATFLMFRQLQQWEA
ncbi:protein phosphatase 1 regulatory subunit 35 [Carettochelys insculpta]|uniref:protein phosphatase 1 regulatory subunit 35 n=1 Tax=Carettochelys insculpta TaxID=44489 RepID=UPI003EBCAA79